MARTDPERAVAPSAPETDQPAEQAQEQPQFELRPDGSVAYFTDSPDDALREAAERGTLIPERAMSEDYAYIDPDATPASPAGLGQTEATNADLNPAFVTQPEPEQAPVAAAAEPTEPEKTEAPAETGEQAEQTGEETGGDDAPPADAPAADADAPADPPADEKPSGPAKPDGNDSAAKWRAWAVAQPGGPTEEEAVKLTRGQIMDRYAS